MDTSLLLTGFRTHVDVVNSTAKTSVQFHCIATSNDFICLGASTGSTYVFGRKDGKLLKFFSNKVDAVKALDFSPDGKKIAVADRSGAITCWEIDDVNVDFKVMKEISEFQGSQITAMCWSETSNKLYVGNKNGLVMGFAIGFAFHKSEVIRKAGDTVVQMDISHDRLVVSSTDKAVLCFLERAQVLQIGTKPRDGFYGSCFMKNRPDNQPIIYSARPGSRLWEVDYNGQVLATHQFKESLSTPPTPIVACKKLELPKCNLSWNSPQALNFPKLLSILDRYLVTWSNLGIYLIDPSIGSIVSWNDQIKDIRAISCSQNCIYILHTNGSLTELSLLNAKQCLLELRKLEDWAQLAEVSLAYEQDILQNVEQFLSIGFDDVLQRLQEENIEKDGHLVKEFEEMIKRVEKCHSEIRMLVQEKLNQMKVNTSDDSIHQSDITDDSGDDVRSNTLSEGISETSSKISLSRLVEVKDNLVQKAANVMVSKVMKTGFMKKALRDALELEGVIIDDNKEQLPKGDIGRTHSVPSSPRVKRIATVQRRQSDTLPKTEVATAADPRERFLQRKTVSTPALSSADHENETQAEFSVERKKVKKTKKKRKAKMVELTMAEEAVEYTSDQSTQKLKKHEESEQVTWSTSFEMQNEKENERSEIPNVKMDGADNNDGNEILELPPNTMDVVNKLVNATYNTRNNFRDAGILYNPKSFLEKLKAWSACLEEVTRDFREECFRLLDPSIQREMNNTILAYLDVQCNSLFFNQSHSAFSEICNLGMLCFETNTFPPKCSVFKMHEISLLNGQTSLEMIMSSALDEIRTVLKHKSTSVSEDENNTPVECRINTKDPPSQMEGNVPDLIQDIRNVNIGDLLDRKSLSTIASEIEIPSASFSCDILHDSVDVLVNKPTLCENYSLFQGESCESCAIDKCRACFVLRYFSVINITGIRSLLLSTSKCRWRTWLAYVAILTYTHRNSHLSKKLMEPNTTDAIILHEVSNTDLKYFFANMSTIYNRSIELFLNCITCKDLSQWETTILMYSGIVGSGQSVQEEYFQYCDERITDDWKLDAIFVRCIVESALKYQPDRTLMFCETCNKVRPGSSRVQWRWGRLLKKLIKNLSRNSLPKDQPLLGIVSRLCLENGFWYGFVRCNPPNNKVLTLLCQIGDAKFFEDFIQAKRVDLREEQCDVMLNYFIEQSSSNEISENNEMNAESHVCEPISGWAPTLTLEKLIRITALHCGTRHTLISLKDIDSEKLSKDMQKIYTSLLKAAQIEKKQEEVVSSLIEVASAKVWCESRNIIPHEFQLLKKTEFEGNEVDTILLDNISSTDYIHDESDAVWGCSINISSGECPVCTLPLYLKASYTTASAGLIVFQCGHSFHKVCVPENACITCYYDNLLG